MKKKHSSIKRETHEIDATDKTLGRLATHIATLLRGKHKATFQPHIDAGDVVIVRNAGMVRITGKKRAQKVYYHHSGYPGGLKTEKISRVMQKNPSEALRRAVLQMLPDIRLRKSMMKRLTLHS